MKLFVIPALAACLLFNGCATLGGSTATQIDQAIAQVQLITQKVCGIIPYAESIAKFVGTFTSGGSPLIDTATAVADQLCAAYAKPGARRNVTSNGDITFRARGISIRAHR